jgi:molecular chaperone GrpE (heat shock protein)
MMEMGMKMGGADKKDDGKILDVVQVGYDLNGKEIRAPKVKVGHFE